MPKRDLSLQILKLLSQYIVSSKNIPEGPIFQKTSCMNPDDAEVIGAIEGIKVFLTDKDLETIAQLNQVEDFLERLGISKWLKGEITHLGFRAGTRYERNVDMATPEEDTSLEHLDEADVYNANATE